MRPTCHIICAGPSPRIKLDPRSDDLVIAVDGGFDHCLESGIAPDLFVGDMDSLRAGSSDMIDCEKIVLPVEKDDTDTLFACKEGLRLGFSKFKFHASLGGDIGHELANIQTLAFLARHGAIGELVGETQRVHLVTPQSSPATFSHPTKTRVSVLAFDGEACGVYERGMRWELEDARLFPTLPVGVSNYNTSQDFEIGVKAGSLVVVIGS